MRKYHMAGQEERNILHAVKRGKADWTGFILLGDCLGKHVVDER
jgi:hypothetical protein